MSNILYHDILSLDIRKYISYIEYIIEHISVIVNGILTFIFKIEILGHSY